jgi:hypothetical protein
MALLIVLVFLIVFPFAFEQCGQSLRPLDITLLGACGTARNQNDDLDAALGVIDTPSGAKVDAQLDHAPPTALKSPCKPNERRLISSATAPRTLKSFNPSSQVVNSERGLTENMVKV